METRQPGKHYEAIACEEVYSFSQMEFDKIVYVDLFVQPIAEQLTVLKTEIYERNNGL